MKQVPGYTLIRTEDCPEQHGTLTVLTHDVSGATILLVENEYKSRYKPDSYSLVLFSYVLYFLTWHTFSFLFLSFQASPFLSVHLPT